MVEYAPESSQAQVYRELARILAEGQGGVVPRPLTPSGAGRDRQEDPMKPGDRSCALAGALTVTLEIEDCITILHGPPGCCHRFPLGQIVDPARVMVTGMTEKEVVFGGEGLLTETIRQAGERRPGMIAVISSCIAGVIGDDAVALCRELETEAFLLAIPADGFLTGGFYAGIQGAMEALIKDFLPQSPGPVRTDTVNILGEKNLAVDEEDSFREMARLLGLLGLRVGARFVRQTSSRRLQEAGRACLNIVRDPAIGSLAAELLHNAYGTPTWMGDILPAGRRRQPGCELSRALPGEGLKRSSTRRRPGTTNCLAI